MEVAQATHCFSESAQELSRGNEVALKKQYILPLPKVRSISGFSTSLNLGRLVMCFAQWANGGVRVGLGSLEASALASWNSGIVQCAQGIMRNSKQNCYFKKIKLLKRSNADGAYVLGTNVSYAQTKTDL